MKTLDEMLANVPPEKLEKIRERFEELRDRELEQKLREELEKTEPKH